MKREFVQAPGFWDGIGNQYLVLILVGAVVLWEVLKYVRRRSWNSRKSYTKKKQPYSPTPKQKKFSVVPASSPDMANPQAQLEAISKVSFEKRRLLNKTEYKVLQVLEATVNDCGDGHRIMAQTSLGELIQPRPGSGTDTSRKQAFASINSKRLDFAIVDRYGLLAAAIEVQGSGHYHHKTFLRDAVKREALRRAGVELIEVQESWLSDEISSRIRTVLRANGSTGAHTPA